MAPKKRPTKSQLLAAFGLLLLLALFVAAPRAHAHEEFTPGGKTVGIGVQVGSPTALTALFVLGPDFAADVGVGGIIGWGPSLSLHGDLIWDPYAIIENESLTLSPTLGAGAFVALAPQRFAPILQGIEYTRSPLWTGVRTPMGALLSFHQTPVGFSAELAPTLFVYPQVAFDVGASLGVRFYL